METKRYADLGAEMRSPNDKSSCPVKLGERLIVIGRPEKAIVDNALWVESEARWKIILDWGEHGMSRVWGDDEGKTWVRPSSLN